MSNQAAWIVGPKARPLQVKSAPMPKPEPHEVVLRVKAVAMNPVDTAMQDMDRLIKAYPHVLGCDAAGEVTEVGSAVTHFEVGDRVCATLDAIETSNPSNGSFQLYCKTTEKLVGKLAANTSYTEACVLPLAMSTAAAGLFQKENMALPYPQVPPKPTNKTLLVWGGSSSVGSCAVQMAIGAGYQVATTASAHNLEHCKSLGATWAFDHTRTTVVEDIVTALEGKEFGGAFDAISKPETISSCAKVITKLGGYKYLETVLPGRVPRPDDLPEDIQFGKVFGLSPAHNEVGEAIWWSWVPAALADGSLKCKPDPEVIGQGLEHVQAALDRLKEGVSGKKIVVELP